MPPRNGRGGPGIATQDRLKEPVTTATAKRRGTSASSLSGRRLPRQPVPLAPASVFGPVGRRTSWWYTYRCSSCGAYLFGRARDLDSVTRERLAGCGHQVRIVAARIYTQPSQGAAA